MEFEIANQMYNLAIIDYHLGCTLMVQKTDDLKKLAIKKFRQTIWCLEEIQNIISKMG